MTCYETKQIDETLDELKTSKNGLSEAEALKRLEADGKNELKEKKKKMMVQEQKYLLKSVVNLLLQFVRAEVLTQM